MNIGETFLQEKSYSRKNKIIIFLSIVLVKLVIMGIFSSDYQNDMFIPFVKTFIQGHNPYEYYYQNNLLDSFPYFPLMLLIESIGGIPVVLFSVGSIFFRNILFKLPLLIFDILCFYFISKMGIKYKYNTILYFCSPIILYGTYMHSQLDIIPTTFLVIAIYYLINSNRENKGYYLYALFLGLALSTKLHIIAAVPVLLIYVYKKRNLFFSIRIHFLSFFIVICFVGLFWGDGFVNKVLFNKEQSVLFDVFLDYGSTRVVLPVFALVIFYLILFELNYFNKNLLLAALTMLFAVFLICIPPMPAWFIWIVPFVAIYFNSLELDKYQTLWIYFVFNIVYLVYFIFFHQTEFVDIYFLNTSLQFFKVDNSTLKFLVFTGMAACLGLVIMKIYRSGMASNNLYKRKNRSFVIGISGDSGAGKSTLLNGISGLFGSSKDIMYIEGDGDHRWERGNSNWEKYTALNPHANFLYRQAEDIRKLKNGNTVERAEYDHNTGEFTERKRLYPRKYIILSGLHSLYLPQLRKELDLKIFMDTDETLRKLWKYKRDSEERGYSLDEVEKQIAKRMPDAKNYIKPQRKFADFIVKYYCKNVDEDSIKNLTLDSDILKNLELSGKNLSVRFELNIDYDLEVLVREFVDYEIYPNWSIQDDLIVQVMDFDGDEVKDKVIDFDGIASRIIPQYEDIFAYTPNWNQGIDGIVQFMVLLMISHKMKG